jgi:hypothetical protein
MIVVVAGCASATAPPKPPPSPPLTGSDYCQMAAAALHQVVRSHDKQPFGLDESCVREKAGSAGKIYADARFTEHESFVVVPRRSCTVRDIVIRFDHQHYEPSPTAAVVVLLISDETPAGRPYAVRVDAADWQTRSFGDATSPCGSATGTLRRFGSGWTASVTPPPPS